MAAKENNKRRYRGRTPEQLRTERRERLLATALELFCERGYNNGPIELLCSTARVTTRHFYEQFASREALLKALFHQIVEQTLKNLAAEIDIDSTDVNERISRSIHAGVDFLTEDPRRARILCLETVGVSPQMEASRREVIHAFARVISRYAKQMSELGALPKRDYYLPALAIVGAVQELLIEWLLGDTGLDADGLAREMVLIFRALAIGSQRYSG